MPVHANYCSTESAKRLRDEFLALERRGREAGLKWPRGGFEWLIGIPSNPDGTTAAILGVRPRHVLLLATAAFRAPVGTPADANVLANIAAMTAWWGAHGRTLVGHDVEFHLVGVAGPGVLETQVLRAVQACEISDASRCVVAVSGGRTEHKADLLRYAELHGMWQVRSEPEYEGGRAVPGTIRLDLDLPPLDVTVPFAQRMARQALRARQFGRARAELNALPPLRDGEYTRALSLWCEALAARDAMRFSDVAGHLGALDVALRELPPGDLQSQRFSALNAAANDLRDRTMVILDEVNGAADTPRLGLILEVLRRGLDEEADGRLNHAALMYYRAIEAVLSERLRCAWGIFDSKPAPEGGRTVSRSPRPGAPLPGPAEVAERFDAIRARRAKSYANLDRPLGLYEKLMLLSALEDPALELGDLPVEELYVTLNDVARARNEGIFAHGFREMRPVEVRRLRTTLVRSRDGQDAPSITRGLVRWLVPDDGLGALTMRWKHLLGHVSTDGLRFEFVEPPRPVDRSDDD